jgi:conserved oligomeric Golgi complex subunit 7
MAFTNFLATFYTSFLLMLNAERTSIPSIFPDPASTLSTLITSALSALQPTFSERLASLCSHHGASALRELIVAYKATEDFATDTEKIMEKIQYSTVLSSPMPSSSMEGSKDSTSQLQRQKYHSRKRSTRMSTSWRANPRQSSLSSGSFTKVASLLGDSLELDWDQELFQPFLDFQVDYASLERRLLDSALNEIVSAGNKSAATETDRARLLKERSVDVFRVAESSLGRCMTFTRGYGSVGLVKALDHFLKSFVDIWTADITSAQSTAFIGRGASDSDLSDLDYTAQDWSDIQMSLHLLASARAVLDRLVMFETKLRSTLIQVATSLRVARNDPSGLSISGTTKGEGLLLIQSSLNSAELHDLLKSVESESQTRHSGSPTPILLEARAAVSTFAKACQGSLQDTLLSPLRKPLAPYALSSLWSAASSEQSKRSGMNELQMPTFSLSPTDVVQRLAEGLLNLPRLFEVYADDDALSFSLETLPYIDAELLKELAEQTDASQQALQGHMRRASLTQAIKPSALSPEAVSSAWLSSLGHTILFHMTSNVLPKIRTLTTAGAAQLSSDLGYLSNIVRAINVQYEDLDRWKDYVSMGDEEGRRMVLEKESGDSVLNLVAKMRGWP